MNCQFQDTTLVTQPDGKKKKPKMGPASRVKKDPSPPTEHDQQQQVGIFFAFKNATYSTVECRMTLVRYGTVPTVYV